MNIDNPMKVKVNITAIMIEGINTFLGKRLLGSSGS
jgi:hypothetical protein